ETQMLAARLYGLVAHSRPLPEVDLQELAPGVQTAWVRTLLARDAEFRAPPQLLLKAAKLP
ncbi:UNVERIFIED_CONTAM: hypothetical protein QOZ27_31440, partial [Pseudomonas aeruginosa]